VNYSNKRKSVHGSALVYTWDQIESRSQLFKFQPIGLLILSNPLQGLNTKSKWKLQFILRGVLRGTILASNLWVGSMQLEQGFPWPELQT